nr:endoglucanase GH5_25 [uncultured bacterium]
MTRTLLLSAAFLLCACSQVESAQTSDSYVPQSTAYEESLPTYKTAQLGALTSPPTNYFPVRRCINMGNALEAENEGEWGYTIRERDFHTIAKAGFDTVRIPVRWDLKTSDQPPYRIQPALMQRVIDVTGQAQNAGLGVIIDVHHYRDLMANVSPKDAEKFLAIWAQISQAFAAAPPTVYFELLNEPTDADMGQLNNLYARALQIIRRTNPRRAVMMGGNRWSSIDTLGDVRFPRDPYLVATYHDYGPHKFTHQGASWDENAPPLGQTWGTRQDRAELRSIIDQARAYKARTGLPVFVGEFGVINTVPDNERAEWIRAKRTAMEQAGISWCVWDYSAAFNSYDMKRERWKPQILNALLGR